MKPLLGWEKVIGAAVLASIIMFALAPKHTVEVSEPPKETIGAQWTYMPFVDHIDGGDKIMARVESEESSDVRLLVRPSGKESELCIVTDKPVDNTGKVSVTWIGSGSVTTHYRVGYSTDLMGIFLPYDIDVWDHLYSDKMLIAKIKISGIYKTYHFQISGLKAI